LIARFLAFSSCHVDESWDALSCFSLFFSFGFSSVANLSAGLAAGLAAAFAGAVAAASALVQEVELPSGQRARFYCPNRLCFYRAITLLQKEPETIEWINTFAPDDVLWDVGANVGLYSVYAALERRSRVVAFEPSLFNLGILGRNVEINSLGERVVPLGVAIGAERTLAFLEMGTTVVGGAQSSFGVATDHQGMRFEPAFRQATLGFSIDGLLRDFSLPHPNHLKIDVDGLEARVVKGA